MLLSPFLLLTSTLSLSLASPLSSAKRSLAPLLTPPLVPNSPPALQPHLFQGSGSEPHIVQDGYIIKLRKDTSEWAKREHHEIVAQFHNADKELRFALRQAGTADEHLTGVHHVFDLDHFSGYSGKFSPSVRDAIRALPEVEYVERDSVVWASETQTGAPWGLARISHRKALGFGSFNKYLYDVNGGEGVDAYVVDTGVNVDHVEFEGRAKWGKTIPQNDVDKDGNGHGTHVAGTIASRKYGVAKKAQIIAVKVLGSGGSGTMSDVVAGVVWAAQSAAAKAKSEAGKAGSKFKGSVANMSLGGGKSQPLNDAVAGAVKSGLHFAVAAGNENADACNTSPASVEEAVTVGASTIADELAYFSNNGPCVDIQAPGLNILSTWNTGNTAVNTISGTSMASPHVAGALAYYLSLYPDNFQPTEADYLSAGLPVPTTASSTSFTSAVASDNMIEIIYKVHRGGQVVVGKLVEYISSPFSSSSSRRTLGDSPAPIDPKVLKAAVIRIGTQGVLKGLPDKTVNVLLFNNFTA